MDIYISTIFVLWLIHTTLIDPFIYDRTFNFDSVVSGFVGPEAVISPNYNILLYVICFVKNIRLLLFVL
jgi:hypothetical protein